MTSKSQAKDTNYFAIRFNNDANYTIVTYAITQEKMDKLEVPLDTLYFIAMDPKDTQKFLEEGGAVVADYKDAATGLIYPATTDYNYTNDGLKKVVFAENNSQLFSTMENADTLIAKPDLTRDQQVVILACA